MTIGRFTHDSVVLQAGALISSGPYRQAGEPPPVVLSLPLALRPSADLGVGAVNMLSLQAAGIFSTTIEAILYGESSSARPLPKQWNGSRQLSSINSSGYSVFMFMLAMYIMLRDRSRRQVNYAMVAAGCSLLVLATAVCSSFIALFSWHCDELGVRLQEMGVNIARVYQGFVSKGPTTKEGPEGYFADVSELTFVVKSCLYNAQTLILDAVVVSIRRLVV